MTEVEALKAGLERFLTIQYPANVGVKVTHCEPIPGRYSKVMTRFDVHAEGKSRSFVTRADAPSGQSLFQTDLTAEWQLLSTLTELDSVPMPAARWFDEDGSALGAKTIVFDYQRGSKLTEVLAREDADYGTLADELAAAAAAVSAVPVDKLPTSIARPANWSSWLDSRIAEFRHSEKALGQPDPVIRYIAAWLDEHRPPPVPLTLVHGDLNPTNVLVDSDGSMTLLDWEFGHIGDPREDIGMMKLGGFFTPPDLLTRSGDRFLAHYRKLTGLKEDELNASTVAYFAILSSIEPVGRLLKQVGDYSSGATDNVMMAYSSVLISKVHRAYLTFLDEAATRLAAN